MAGAENRVTMHLHSGIPVVRMEGEWSESVCLLLTETVDKLTLAGHLQIVIDLSRARCLSFLERDWLDSLEQLAAALRSRYGRLDVIGTAEYVRTLARRKVSTLIRWATCEEEAICHIKGLPMTTAGARTNIRLKSR